MYTVSTFPVESSNIAPGFQARIEQEGYVNPEIVRLRTKNPLWQVYAPEWELYLEAYEGGPDFACGKNLFKHQRENPDDFNDRVRRLHYTNYCEPLTDFFTNFIFTETIQRDGGSNNNFYLDFIKDVNKKGDDVTDYMKNVSSDMQIFGMSYTLVDTPKSPAQDGTVLSQQEEAELGLRPYWVLIKPEEIIDWDVDDFENVTYTKRLQAQSQRIDGISKPVEKYTEWYPDKTVVSVVDVSSYAQPQMLTQDEYPNVLGYIPLVCARYKRSKRHPYMGNSFLRDFAYNNREVMNYTSLLQEFLYRQCFNILAKESDTSVPFRDQEDNITGTSNVIEYPKGAEAPAYISPPVAPAQFVQSERERIISEMFKRASQDMLNELFNGEKSSGFSQAQSFSKTVPFIATRADTLEKTEVALMKLTMKLISKDWDGKIKYKDRYELTNITDAISQLTMIFKDLLMPSETFVKEEFKRLVHELDGKLSPDVLAKILKEIDGMDFAAWQETMKEALVGGKAQQPGQATSPTGEQQKPKPTPNKPTSTAESAAESRTS
jgi:hypothetical protein